MTDVGSQLRTAREAQGLTIDQAYKATRIKPIYLEAIEANRMSALPGPVQARGFVRSYANFLGLDGEALASALDAAPVLVVPNQVPMAATKPAPLKPVTPAVTAKPLAPAPDRAVPRGGRTLELPSLPKINVPSARDTAPASPGGVPTSLLIIGAVVLFAIGVILIISALTSNARPSNPLDLNVPSAAKPLAVPAVAGSTEIAGPVSITVEATEHVWARISLDGQKTFEGVLQPGSSQVLTAAEKVVIETGNAAAIRVNYNGAVGALGTRGQIVSRTWSRSGSPSAPVTNASELSATGVQAAPASTSTQRP